jgi:hypothetical protein
MAPTPAPGLWQDVWGGGLSWIVAGCLGRMVEHLDCGRMFGEEVELDCGRMSGEEG